VLTAEGALDRPALAAVVFADPEARRRLDGIVHPLVRSRAASWSPRRRRRRWWCRGRAAARGDRAGGLLRPGLVVQADPGHARPPAGRPGAVRGRRRARIAAQATDEQRRAVADVVLDNSGTVEELEAQVDRFWAERVTPALD
jgi:dephospho-CoA kinase